MIIKVQPNEFLVNDILNVKNKLENKESIEYILTNEFIDKNISVRFIKDKLIGTSDLDGVNLWYIQACSVNDQFPYANTMEFCSAYRLLVKKISIKELLTMKEYEKNIIFNHLEEIIKDIIVLPEVYDEINIIKESDKDKFSIRLQESKPPISFDEQKQNIQVLIKYGKERFIKSYNPLVNYDVAEKLWFGMLSQAKDWGIDIENLNTNC